MIPHKSWPFPVQGKEQDWLQGEVWEEHGDVRACPIKGEKCPEPFDVPEVCQEIFPNDFTSPPGVLTGFGGKDIGKDG